MVPLSLVFHLNHSALIRFWRACVPIAIHSYKFRYAKVLLVALSLAFHFDKSAPIRFSLYDSINKNKETEPFHSGFISLFHQPNHRYRTLKCTFHLHVSPAKSPLQNLKIHTSSPCFSSRAIATEPLHTRSISMFLYRGHRYRTLKYTLHLPVPPSPSPLQSLTVSPSNTPNTSSARNSAAGPDCTVLRWPCAGNSPARGGGSFLLFRYRSGFR